MFVCVRVQEKLVVRTAVVLVIVSRTVLNLRQYRTSRHRTSAVRTTLLLAPRTGRTTGNTGQQLKRLKKSIVIAATDRLYKRKSSQACGNVIGYWTAVYMNFQQFAVTGTSYRLQKHPRMLCLLPTILRGCYDVYSFCHHTIGVVGILMNIHMGWWKTW